MRTGRDDKLLGDFPETVAQYVYAMSGCHYSASVGSWRIDQDDEPIGDFSHAFESLWYASLDGQLRPVFALMSGQQNRVEIQEYGDRAGAIVGQVIGVRSVMRNHR